MVEFKLNIGDPKTGLCVQKVITDTQASVLIGLKIKDRINGDSIGFPGYEFEITGGSDYCGFPLRKGISVPRKKIMITKGVGLRHPAHKRGTLKTVCGEMINDKTVQINLKIIKEGKEKLVEKKEKTKESAAETNKEEKKE